MVSDHLMERPFRPCSLAQLRPQPLDLTILLFHAGILILAIGREVRLHPCDLHL